MKVFLSGPMGAGKSTVGSLLADRLGARFLDLDVQVAASTGRTPADWIRTYGEGALRDAEGRTLERILSEHAAPLVLSLGGGTVTRRDTRRRLLHAGTLLTLHASTATLLGRLQASDTESRPLLQGSGSLRERLEALWHERLEAYAECHGWVCNERDPQRAADAAAALVRAAPLLVPLGRDSYRVHFERGGAMRFPDTVPLHDPLRSGWHGRTVLVVSDPGSAPFGARVARALEDHGACLPPRRIVLPGAPGTKHIDSLRRLWEAALAEGADRRTVLIAVGGGAVGDVTAFAAGTLLRGVGLVQVPTTLLAMADSAIGGKAAVDLPHGKNLVGIFHHPLEVLLDTEALERLPERERIAGFAEVVKAAWIEGERAVESLERDAEVLRRGEPQAVERALRMALAVKARLVAEDERDHGRRHLLNLGHTLGHALEAAEGFHDLRHGEAVALGLLGSLRVARALGTARREELARMGDLLERLGLPTNLEEAWRPEAAAFLARDKKRRGRRIRFVLPGPPGHATLHDLDADDILRLAGLPGEPWPP